MVNIALRANRSTKACHETKDRMQSRTITVGVAVALNIVRPVITTLCSQASKAV